MSVFMSNISLSRYDILSLLEETDEERNHGALVFMMKEAFPAEIHGNFNLPFISEVADRA